MLRGLITTSLCFALLACQSAVPQSSEVDPREALARLVELEQKPGISEDLRVSVSNVAQALEDEVFVVEPAAPPPEIEPAAGIVSGQVVDGPANVRREPKITAERVGRLAVGEEVHITGHVQNWYEIALQDGNLAYVYEELSELALESACLLGARDEVMENPQIEPPQLEDALEVMGREVTAESPSYSQPAFQCRQDYGACQSQYRELSYQLLYCHSAMALCLVDIVLP